MEPIDEAASARGESVLLMLLSRCLLRPTADFVGPLRDGTTIGTLQGLLVGCPDEELVSALAKLDGFQMTLAQLPAEEARLLLETDYNRLFVGPCQLLAPPYESFYTTEKGEDGRGHLRGAAERSVLAEYRRHGYTMPDEFVEFPDHIAVELEYLGLLASQEAESWERDDRATALRLQEEEDAFRREHLGIWFGDLARGVAEGARQPFYPAITAIIGRTVLV